MTNTPLELELFDLIAQLHKHHSVALHDDGTVTVAKLDSQGMPYEDLPLFPSVQDAVNWAKRINKLEPWKMPWMGPG
jgi:hypothetical protein